MGFQKYGTISRDLCQNLNGTKATVVLDHNYKANASDLLQRWSKYQMQLNRAFQGMLYETLANALELVAEFASNTPIPNSVNSSIQGGGDAFRTLTNMSP
jgi:hypothetical protein